MSALGAMEAAAGPAEPLFRPLSAEDGEQQPAEIESLCMNCFRNVRGPGGRAAEACGGRGAEQDRGLWGPGRVCRSLWGPGASRPKDTPRVGRAQGSGLSSGRGEEQAGLGVRSRGLGSMWDRSQEGRAGCHSWSRSRGHWWGRERVSRSSWG